MDDCGTGRGNAGELKAYCPLCREASTPTAVRVVGSGVASATEVQMLRWRPGLLLPPYTLGLPTSLDVQDGTKSGRGKEAPLTG